MQSWIGKIYDPKGEVEIRATFAGIKGQYFPEDIQKLIDEQGIGEMVRIVNEHFWLLRQPFALQLTHDTLKNKILLDLFRKFD